MKELNLTCAALHLALLKNKLTIEELTALLKSEPDAVRQTNQFSALPLHLACGWRRSHKVNPICVVSPLLQSHEVIAALLEAYPAAAGATDDCRRFPLNYLIRSKAEVDTVRLLISSYPLATHQLIQRYPLRLALKTSAAACVISALLEADDSKDMKICDEDWKPLHYALKHKATAEVVGLIAEAIPASVFETEKYTLATPFYVAVKMKAHIDVLRLLLRLYPPAISMRCANHYSPLDIMAFRQPTFEAFKLLFDADPSVACTKACYGGYTLQIAIDSRASAAMIIKLLYYNAYPHAACVKYRNKTSLEINDFDEIDY